MESSMLRSRAAAASPSPVRSRQPSPTGTAAATTATSAAPARMNDARQALIQQQVIAQFGPLAPQAAILLDLPGRALKLTGASVLDSLAGTGARMPDPVIDPAHYKACEALVWDGVDVMPDVAEAAILLMTALETFHVAGETDDAAPRGEGAVSRQEITDTLREIRQSCTAYIRQLLGPNAGLHVLSSWSLHLLSAHAGAGDVHDALAQVERTFRQELGRLFMEDQGRRSMERPSALPDPDRLFRSFILLALHDKDGIWPFLTIAIRNCPDYKIAMPLAGVLSTFIGQTREFGRPETDRLTYEEANPMLGRFDEIDIKIRRELRPVGFRDDHIHGMRDICAKTVWALYKALEQPETFDSRRIPIMKQMRQDLMAVMHGIEAEFKAKAIRV